MSEALLIIALTGTYLACKRAQETEMEWEYHIQNSLVWLGGCVVSILFILVYLLWELKAVLWGIGL